jgi:hypothetical protein
MQAVRVQYLIMHAVVVPGVPQALCFGSMGIAPFMGRQEEKNMVKSLPTKKQPNKDLIDLITEAVRIEERSSGEEVSDSLEGAIIDLMMEEADALSNKGYVVQLQYLVSHGGADQARQALKALEQELNTLPAHEEESL